MGGTSTTEETIKITNHNRDWAKALNEPLIMSTAPLRTAGGDHLVETGFVTRGLGLCEDGHQEKHQKG